MTELLTTAQMRATEADAIGAGEVSGAVLMERAGEGVVAAVFARWPEFAREAPAVRPGVGGGCGYLDQEEAAGRRWRVLVLCGPGNNGGDGFVIARLLAERGWAVELRLYGEAGRLPPDARLNHDRWCGMGVVRPLEGGKLCEADLVVDALFGIGLARPVALPLCHFGSEARVVAVDVPSGLCADSGRVIGGRVLKADLTVTFHRAKPGHYLAEGPEVCGSLAVVDLGLAAPAGTGGIRLVDGDVAGSFAKSARGNKFDHGHALVLAGPAGCGGAARLAARGALRIGAGLVTVGAPRDAMAEHAARLDAVMLRPVGGAGDLAAVLRDPRIGALCLGPGFGLGARQAASLGIALGSGRALVLDADALTLIARTPGLFGALHGGCVLTPHGGEFARLFPDLALRLAAPCGTGPAFSRLDAARMAAERAEAVILLKGADTVIAAPDGRLAVSAACYGRAAPWLATAGAGDVLAGFIAGLLARGFAPFDAACAAAWMHVECARAFGPGLIAEDLPEAVPGVLRGLAEARE